MFFKQFLIFLSLSLIPISPSPPTKSESQDLPFIHSQIAPNKEGNSSNRSSKNRPISQTQSDKPIPDKRPAPPSRIPPNKVKPGGGLDPSRQACTKNNDSLIALVPVENPVLTTKAYPSFLFYIPDPPTALSYGEFSIFTANEKTRVYSTEVAFKQVPGIIKINVPQSSEYALEEEQVYHWYFRVYCQGSSDSSVVLDVDGWVQRVPLTSNRQSQIETASPEIWYDAIAAVATNLMMAPDNLAVRDRWLQLLRHINLEHLASDRVIYSYQEQDNRLLQE